MKTTITAALLSLCCLSAQASTILQGKTTITVHPNAEQAKSLRAQNHPLRFSLPQYALTTDAQNYLHKQLVNYKPSPKVTAPDLPSQIYVGMENTPVLDQGYHGSCVTFAITAALDATMGAGDYISQLCNLELGSYLAANNKAEASGWDGSYDTWVLQQIADYGIISKNYQKLKGCSGMTDYPLTDEENRGNPMTESDFLAHGIPLTNLIHWHSVLRDEDAFSDKVDTNELIHQIKTELVQGNRLTVGMLLDVAVGDAGALGSFRAANDTWMLTPQIINDASDESLYAGHEMVIIGYDDEAEVTDDKGYVNKGVFRLRNSWSELAGDKGDYYVSYDYLKTFALELMAYKIRPKAHQQD